MANFFKEEDASAIIRNLICEICGLEPATQWHHCFPKKKWVVKLYPDFINDRRNLKASCAKCNVSHANPDIPIWNEKEFCEVMKIEVRGKVELRNKLMYS